MKTLEEERGRESSPWFEAALDAVANMPGTGVPAKPRAVRSPTKRTAVEKKSEFNDKSA